jgi:hypothetical protein
VESFIGESKMPTIESSIYIEPSKRKKNPKEELDRMNGMAILFIANNPTPIFTIRFNAEKQALMELEFCEETVENPEAREEKLRGYVC